MTSKKRKSNLFLGKIKEKILTCHERPKLYYLRQGAVQSPIELQPSRGEFSPILWTRNSKSLQQGLGIHSFRRKGPAQHSETFLNDSHVIHEKVRGGLREPGESKCGVIFLTTSDVRSFVRSFEGKYVSCFFGEVLLLPHTVSQLCIVLVFVPGCFQCLYSRVTDSLSAWYVIDMISFLSLESWKSTNIDILVKEITDNLLKIKSVAWIWLLCFSSVKVIFISIGQLSSRIDF